MTIVLDYKQGDKIICLIDKKFSVETFTGNAHITIRDGVTTVRYEIDRPDATYPNSLKESVEDKYCFKTKQEALLSIGLNDIPDVLV